MTRTEARTGQPRQPRSTERDAAIARRQQALAARTAPRDRNMAKRQAGPSTEAMAHKMPAEEPPRLADPNPPAPPPTCGFFWRLFRRDSKPQGKCNAAAVDEKRRSVVVSTVVSDRRASPARSARARRRSLKSVPSLGGQHCTCGRRCWRRAHLKLLAVHGLCGSLSPQPSGEGAGLEERTTCSSESSAWSLDSHSDDALATRKPSPGCGNPGLGCADAEALLRHACSGGAAREKLRLLVVTDPGPDPDDVKVVVAAACLHLLGEVELLGVVCNGGGQAVQRAKLARAVLLHCGAVDVPVGVGSDGSPYTPQPHEYDLDGFDAVDPDTELRGGRAVLMDALRSADAASLTFLLISSQRDLAQVIGDAPDLFRAKTRHVCVMGGVQRAEDGSWTPDTSSNNEFDRAASQQLYSFCFAHGVKCSVISRHSVPDVPMALVTQLAASGPPHPVLAYLAEAQQRGLIGLWSNLCKGRLPLRCTKQWYFATFCATEAEAFTDGNYAALGADADIARHLRGTVKPYDVCALMLALPNAAEAFDLRPELHTAGDGKEHHLHLSSETKLDVRHVSAFLHSALVLVAEGLEPRGGEAPNAPPAPSRRRRR